MLIKLKLSLPFKPECGNEENKQTTAKAKKRRKRKKKEETVEKTIDGESISETFWASFCKATEDKLTDLELDDLTVEGNFSAFS